jgi:hypothetical protein
MQAELVFLRDIFRQNGYRQIHRALNGDAYLDQPGNEPSSVTFLPFVGTIISHISRVLA